MKDLVARITERRKRLEEELAHIARTFQEETGLSISRVDYLPVDVTTYESAGVDTLPRFKVGVSL